MTYQLTPVPYCLGSPDGHLSKTNKAKGFQFITEDRCIDQQPDPCKTLLIVDGNALYHSMTEIPETFKQVSEKIFKMIPGNCDVIFSTDIYKKNSLKSSERSRRGVSEKNLVKGPYMKRPHNWKEFLSNDDNKKQFTELLLKVWSNDEFSDNIKNRKVIITCGESAYMLKSKDDMVTKDEILSLRSSQEETDTRVVLYSLFAADLGYENVRVKSPDSDIYFILLHHASLLRINIFFDTGYGNQRKLFNITEHSRELGPNHCAALLSVNAITGCDTTSCFMGVGKQKPLKN